MFVVTKFYPHHAKRKALRAACEGSLARLAIDRIDCYLYHWRGATPLEETVGMLAELVADGKIASWGVSNFDVADLEELVATPGAEVTVDLEGRALVLADGTTATFPIDPFARYCLMEGKDELQFLLAQEAAIAAHENRMRGEA